MRTTIVLMYSGQQKSPTSSDDPDPTPPPVVRPKPMPRTPVSAGVLPGVTFSPFVRFRPRASSTDVFAADGCVLVTRAFGGGMVISGAFAAGRVTASRFGGSSGGRTC